jgi:hypothetical protein
MHAMPRERGSAIAAIFGLLLMILGCGSDGFSRHRIQGTVTYDGKPLEDGVLFFEPTAAAGQMAPTVYVKVRNGQYDTGKEGPITGKYRVVLTGLDKANERLDDDNVLHTPLLFPDHKFEVDIPPPNNRLDIEVPKTEERPRR